MYMSIYRGEGRGWKVNRGNGRVPNMFFGEAGITEIRGLKFGNRAKKVAGIRESGGLLDTTL